MHRGDRGEHDVDEEIVVQKDHDLLTDTRKWVRRLEKREYAIYDCKVSFVTTRVTWLLNHIARQADIISELKSKAGSRHG